MLIHSSALERYEGELAEANRDAQLALRRRESLRQVVVGLRGLLEAKTSPDDRQLTVSDEGSATESATVTAQPHLETNGEPVPAGGEAVRRILPSADGEPLTLKQVIAGMEEQGWMSQQAKHPEASVRAAIQRLLAEGEIERVARGTYRLVPRTENRFSWGVP